MKKDDSEKTKLWKRVCVTDPKQVKPITGKQYRGNSPKPYWIVERLTEEFGPCGLGWGFTVLNERMEPLGSSVLHIAVIRFWYVLDGQRGELEQIGQTMACYEKADGSKTIVDEDAPKKSVTDALVKCASYLGFAGDIFSGRWDDSKYVAWAREQYADEEPEKGPIPDTFRSSPTMGAMDELRETDPDAVLYIETLASTVIRKVESGHVAEAYGLIEKEKFGDPHKPALWSLLPSRVRTPLTKHGLAMKAQRQPEPA